MHGFFCYHCNVSGLALSVTYGDTSPFGRAAEQGEAERARMLTAKNLPHILY